MHPFVYKHGRALHYLVVVDLQPSVRIVPIRYVVNLSQPVVEQHLLNLAGVAAEETLTFARWQCLTQVLAWVGKSKIYLWAPCRRMLKQS